MTSPTVPAERLHSLLGPLPPDRPAYRGLADGIRLLVADGRVAAGSRLPSERDLTGATGLSRTTVTRAYALLREAGYVTSRRGSGTVATLPNGVARRGTGASLFPAEVPDDVIDLTCAATRAPRGTAEAYERAVAGMPPYLAGAGYFTLGVPELRSAVAHRFSARGLPTDPEQVLITSGAVAGLAVVVRALLSPGDRVLVESPGYPNSADALRRGRMRLTPVTVDPDGWDTATVVSAVRAARAAAAVLVPDFHNPTGALMPDEQRAEVALALRRAGTVPVVDETVAEVALDPTVARPLPFAAHHDGTVTVGSASKSHWGGLRTGWVRAPHALVPELLDARATLDLGAPVLEQLVTRELLDASTDGLAPGRAAELRESRDAAVAALAALRPALRHHPAPGGLSLWLELPVARATEVVLAAEELGLLLASGPRFAVGGGLERWVRLPHVLPPETMTEAVRRLGAAVEVVLRSPSRAGGPRRDRARGATGPLVA